MKTTMMILIFRIVERLVEADPWQPAQFRWLIDG